MVKGDATKAYKLVATMDFQLHMNDNPMERSLMGNNKVIVDLSTPNNMNKCYLSFLWQCVL